jgi:hypothetical protein
MSNSFMTWLKEKLHTQRGITLDDVKPMHPYEYPARGLKARLDARRDEMEAIEAGAHPTGLPNGPGAFT